MRSCIAAIDLMRQVRTTTTKTKKLSTIVSCYKLSRDAIADISCLAKNYTNQTSSFIDQINHILINIGDSANGNTTRNKSSLLYSISTNSKINLSNRTSSCIDQINHEYTQKRVDSLPQCLKHSVTTYEPNPISR